VQVHILRTVAAGPVGVRKGRLSPPPLSTSSSSTNRVPRHLLFPPKQHLGVAAGAPASRGIETRAIPCASSNRSGRRRGSAATSTWPPDGTSSRPGYPAGGCSAAAPVLSADGRFQSAARRSGRLPARLVERQSGCLDGNDDGGSLHAIGTAARICWTPLSELASVHRRVGGCSTSAGAPVRRRCCFAWRSSRVTAASLDAAGF
jgi:hypothetical protein